MTFLTMFALITRRTIIIHMHSTNKYSILLNNSYYTANIKNRNLWHFDLFQRKKAGTQFFWCLTWRFLVFILVV